MKLKVINILVHDIQDPSHRGVHQTLPGHVGDVVSVKFLKSEDSKLHCTAIISGDTAGKVIVWNEDSEHGVRMNNFRGGLHMADFLLQFVRATSLDLPGQVSSLACVEAETGQSIVAVGTSACEVHLYQYILKGKYSGLCDNLYWGLIDLSSQGELQPIQHNFPGGSKIPLSMALTRLSEHGCRSTMILRIASRGLT